MSDSQMKHIGQIQPAKKPTKDKINSAYQHSSPRSQMSWGGVHTSQHVAKNNQIACNVVYFHCGSRGVYSNRNRSSFQTTVKVDKVYSSQFFNCQSIFRWLPTQCRYRKSGISNLRLRDISKACIPVCSCAPCPSRFRYSARTTQELG